MWQKLCFVGTPYTRALHPHKNNVYRFLQFLHFYNKNHLTPAKYNMHQVSTFFLKMRFHLDETPYLRPITAHNQTSRCTLVMKNSDCERNL